MADKNCSEHIAVHWVHIGVISVDIDASGSLWGFQKGLEFAISLCDSENVIFLFFAILTMLW